MSFPITCSACQKTFTVSQEIYEKKVQGRVVTIKCKSCGAGIRVDGTGAPPTPLSAAADYLWAVDYPDGQDREFTRAQIIAELERGAIGGTTLVWREGMPEWQELGQVRELAGELTRLEAKKLAAQAPKLRPRQPTMTGMAPAPRVAVSAGDAAKRRARASSAELGNAEFGAGAELPTPVTHRANPGEGKKAVSSALGSAFPVASSQADEAAAVPVLAQSPAAVPASLAALFDEPAEAGAPFTAAEAARPLTAASTLGADDAAAAGRTGSGFTPFSSFPAALPPGTSAPLSLAAPFPSAVPQRATPVLSNALSELDFPEPKRRGPLLVVLLLLAAAGVGAFVVVGAKDDMPPPPAISEIPKAAPPAPPPAYAAPSQVPAGPAATSGELPSRPVTTPGAGFAEQFAAGARHAEGKGATIPTSERFEPVIAKAALSAVTAQVMACREVGGPSGKVTVTATFEPSGRLSSATITAPPFAGSTTGTCVTNALKRASMNPFNGSPGTVTKTYNIP